MNKVTEYYHSYNKTQYKRAVWLTGLVLVLLVLGILLLRPDLVLVPPNWKVPTNVEYIK